MRKQTFNDIARNLLIYLKAQINQLTPRNNKAEIQRQIQSISFTLRTTLIQLEGAAEEEPPVSGNNEDFERELEDIKQANSKLEESLFLEMNKTQRLYKEVAELTQELEKKTEQDEQLNESKNLLEEKEQLINELKTKISELEALALTYAADETNKDDASANKIKALEEDLEKSINIIEELKGNLQEKNNMIVDLQAEIQKYLAAPPQISDVQTKLKLNAIIARLEANLQERTSEVEELNNIISEQQEHFSAKEKRLKDSLEAIKSEVKLLPDILNDLEIVNKENAQLKKEIELSKKEFDSDTEKLKIHIGELQNKMQILPSIEMVKNREAATNAKIRFLEKSLQETSVRLSEALANQQDIAYDDLFVQREKLELENKTLKGRIKELNNTIAVVNKNKYSFSGKDCVFIFKSLFATSEKFSKGTENLSLKNLATESIEILQASGAIEKILTLTTLYDKALHRVTKTFRSDFFPDNTVIFEEKPGYLASGEVIQHALVWICKSEFFCEECKIQSKEYEFFCTKCGLELTAPDGTSKRELMPHPNSVEVNLPLIDLLIEQKNHSTASKIVEFLSKNHPGDINLAHRKKILASQKEPVVIQLVK